jgi:hypothetical protein
MTERKASAGAGSRDLKSRCWTGGQGLEKQSQERQGKGKQGLENQGQEEFRETEGMLDGA